MEITPQPQTDFIEVNQETAQKFYELGLSKFDIQKVKDDLSEFKASYESPLERAKLLLKNPIYVLEDGSLTVPYWQSTGLRPSGGNCVDLAEELRFKWDYQGFTDQLNKKGLNLLLCVGQEPRYFFRKTDNHIFLTLARPTKPRGASFSGDDMIVVDPAFQKIDTMKNSKYEISKVVSESVHITNNLHHKLVPFVYYKDRRHFIPTTSQNRLVLGMDPKRRYLLNFTTIKNGESYMPGIDVSDENGERSVIYWDKSESEIVNPETKMTPPMDASTNSLFVDIAKRLTGVRFVKAEYNSAGLPVDTNGVPLTFATSHFASGSSYTE